MNPTAIAKLVTHLTLHI